MTVISLSELGAPMQELIHQLPPDSEIIITENDVPVAKLVSASHAAAPERRLGFLAGTVTHMADDFDEPLDDFAEHMQ